MASLSVTEFRGTPRHYAGVSALPLDAPEIATQELSIGVGSVPSAAFNARTSLVRVYAAAACFITFGTDPTATSANIPMAAGEALVFWLSKRNMKVAVITA